MPDIVVPLSDEERALLMIAAEGMPMIPIGRWEMPLKALARRGLMQKLDAFNYVITDAGQAALDAADRDENEQIRKIAGRVANAG